MQELNANQKDYDHKSVKPSSFFLLKSVDKVSSDTANHPNSVQSCFLIIITAIYPIMYYRAISQYLLIKQLSVDLKFFRFFNEHLDACVCVI